jgi:small subunit ribosomal protein S8e
LEIGNFSWSSEAIAKKTRIVRVVYNASNNELVRTNTLVKGAIIEIDATPFRQWYEAHYGLTLGRKKKTDAEAAPVSESVKRKQVARQANGQAKVDPHLEEQFNTGRILARISSRPGQSGRADGVILEGKELDFYLRKLRSRKA